MWGNKLCRVWLWWHLLWGKLIRFCVLPVPVLWSFSRIALAEDHSCYLCLHSLGASVGLGSSYELGLHVSPLINSPVRSASLVGSLWCWVRLCVSTWGKSVGRNSFYKSAINQLVKWASCNKLGGGWCFSSHMRVGKNSKPGDLKGKTILSRHLFLWWFWFW